LSLSLATLRSSWTFKNSDLYFNKYKKKEKHQCQEIINLWTIKRRKMKCKRNRKHILSFLNLTVQVWISLILLFVLLHVIFVSGKEYNQSVLCINNKIHLKFQTDFAFQFQSNLQTPCWNVRMIIRFVMFQITRTNRSLQKSQ